MRRRWRPIGAPPSPADEGVRLIVGDALAVLHTFELSTFDAIISDPPHGVGAAPWDVLPTVTFLRELDRVLKPGGKLVFVGDDRTWHRLAVAVEDAGFQIEGHCLWLWATGRARSAAQPRPAFNPIIVAHKPGLSLIRNVNEARIPWRDDRDRRQAHRAATLRGVSRRRTYSQNLDIGSTYVPHGRGRWPTNVLASDLLVGRLHHIFDISKVRDPSGHPCAKPLVLMSQLLRLYAPPDGLVLDPFAGSGATGVAAPTVGRRAVLIEREPTFARMAQSRLLNVQRSASRSASAPDDAPGRLP
jgi:DNA modification methylase